MHIDSPGEIEDVAIDDEPWIKKRVSDETAVVEHEIIITKQL